MIDVSSFGVTSNSFKVKSPSRIRRTHTNTLKNRRIILARYEKVGNPQDFSQIPQSERDAFNISGLKARSESRERKTCRPSTRESFEPAMIQNLKQRVPTATTVERRIVITRSASQPNIKVPVRQRSHSILTKDVVASGTIRMQTIAHPQSQSQFLSCAKESEASILREKREIENIEDKPIRGTLDNLDEPTKTKRSTIIRSSKVTFTEGSEKKVGFPIPRDSNLIKPVSSIVSMAKFLKKKAQLIVSKGSPRREKPESLTINNNSPQMRLVKMINPEVIEENNNHDSMICSYSNPISAIFEDIPSEEFYKALADGLLSPNKLLEYVENSEMWNVLGDMLDIHTDQKLDYQATYAKFKKNRHFNLEDYGLLEWRYQGEAGTVRKIYHRTNLRVFALRSISLEKFNNDPTDLKNDLRISTVLVKHSHKGILRFISSRLGLSSENSPRYRKSSGPDLFSDIKANLSMNVELVTELGVVNLKEMSKAMKKQGIKWTEDELVILLKELSSALAHCETLGIAHRNIKPSNIFFGEDKVTTKLTDFKLGILLGVRKSKIIEANVVGTPRYMSYELKKVYNNLKAKKVTPSLVKYDPYLSDVSSLALVILELAISSLASEKAVKVEVEASVIMLKEIKEAFPYLAKILQRMLSNEPGIRPRFSELESTLIMPSEAHKREVYQRRYQIVSQLDEMKRDVELCGGLEEYMEMSKVYARLAMAEKQAKKGKHEKDTISSSWKKNKGDMKKKEELELDDKGVGGPTCKDSAVKMLHSCYDRYKRKGQYKKAITACNLMGDIVYQVYQTEEMSVFAYILCGLARMNQLLNQCRESVELYVQAFNIMKRCYGEMSLPAAILLNNIGSLYYSVGEAERVKEVYQRALKIKENLGLKGQIPYAIGLHNLSNTNQICGEIKTAMAGYHEALDIYDGSSDDILREKGEIYLALSVLHYANGGDKEIGLLYINQTLSIYQKASSESREMLMGIGYYRLGMFRYCFKEYEAALEAYDKAIKLLENAPMKQVGLIDAVKDSQRVLKTEAGFLIELKKSKVFLV